MVRPASCCRLHAACDQTHGAGLPQGNVSSPQHVLHGIAYLSVSRQEAVWRDARHCRGNGVDVKTEDAASSASELRAVGGPPRAAGC